MFFFLYSFSSFPLEDWMIWGNGGEECPFPMALGQSSEKLLSPVKYAFVLEKILYVFQKISLFPFPCQCHMKGCFSDYPCENLWYVRKKSPWKFGGPPKTVTIKNFSHYFTHNLQQLIKTTSWLFLPHYISRGFCSR